MLTSLSLPQLLAAFGIVVAGSVLQGSLGFGLGLVAAPILLLIDPALVPGPILVVASLPPRPLAILLAGLVLIAVVLSISGLRFRPTRWALLSAGTLSGFMSTTASTGGPPIALLYQDAPGARLRSTMSGYFSVGTVISIFALALVGRFGRFELLASLALLPAMLAGFALSTRAQGVLDRGYTRAAVLLVSVASSIVVILKQVL
jgi:uncharacterized membrane protein YfcA